MNKKVSTPIEVLCEKYPEEIGKMITYARNMKFEEKPDYDYLRSLIKSAIQKLDIKVDYIYDWDK